LSESWVYRSAWGYGLAMRVLYGRYYTARDTAVAALVPVGSSVLELCCGPARLYLRELRSRTSSYVGIDANTGFVERLAKRGVDARVGDVASADLQPADVVLMQASLYHFLPDAQPMRNLAASGNPLKAWIGSRGTATAVGQQEQRFDEASLDALMGGFGDAVRSVRLIPGGREKVYVLDPA
jgi:SAM-dependent methyltransferase